MQFRNSPQRFGAVSVALHWIVALTVFGLFGLGYWMRTLGYYDPWYHDAPELHKSIGILLFIAMLVRVVWRHLSPAPKALPEHGRLTRIGATLGHILLYVGLFVLMIAGYLISTADDVGISVFGLFTVPASITSITNQADVAGAVHKYQPIRQVLVYGTCQSGRCGRCRTQVPGVWAGDFCRAAWPCRT